eukprot:1326781-Amorphochlora_amoeboformis.AAC.1
MTSHSDVRASASPAVIRGNEKKQGTVIKVVNNFRRYVSAKEFILRANPIQRQARAGMNSTRGAPSRLCSKKNNAGAMSMPNIPKITSISPASSSSSTWYIHVL